MLLLLSFLQFLFWSKILVALFLPWHNFLPLLPMSSQPCQKQHTSPDVQRSKGKTNRFLFAKSKVFMRQLKPYCSVPRGCLLEEGHSHCQWMVKQMGKDSTREKRKEVGGIGNGRKIFLWCTHAFGYCYKVCMSMKITVEITFPFLLLLFTRIWQYSAMILFISGAMFLMPRTLICKEYIWVCWCCGCGLI